MTRLYVCSAAHKRRCPLGPRGRLRGYPYAPSCPCVDLPHTRGQPELVEATAWSLTAPCSHTRRICLLAKLGFMAPYC